MVLSDRQVSTSRSNLEKHRRAFIFRIYFFCIINAGPEFCLRLFELREGVCEMVQLL